MIRFRVLGALDLTRSEGSASSLPSSVRSVLAQPKRLALFAYLALARPRGFHRRDRLLAMFWPDATEERARASLNRAIYFLRREIGEDCIISRGDEEVAIDTDRVWSDVSSFDDCIDRALWREALDLYRGDLLPGFFTSDANGFEEWVERERVYLRGRAAQAAWALSTEAEGEGDIAAATAWARRGMELTPFGEPELRQLLRLLDAAGDRAGATEAYERFAALLAEELELTPAPETRALIEEIQSRVSTTAHGTRSPRVNGNSRASAAIVPAHAPRLVRRRWTIPAVAAVIAVLTPAILLARVDRRNVDRQRVFVARFVNLTRDPNLETLGRVAADRIAQALSATGILQLPAPGSLGGSADRAPADPKSVRVLREADQRHAGLVVSGEIQRSGNQLTIQAWITDVARSSVVWAIHPVRHPSIRRTR
jgi:DNA-binding SARP family transcriptional activator/TolB-like protein